MSTTSETLTTNERIEAIIERLRKVWAGNDDEYYPGDAVNDIEAEIQERVKEARLDEQQNTMTTSFKAGSDGYGQIYYIVDGDELITQEQRIAELTKEGG